jgi:DNA repair exonuclease SbcCD nuclease subunit
MSHAIKFLHASDLHLDRAISGLAEIPSHLKSALTNAAYLAAENLFQAAVSEKVDIVMLAGDVVDLDAGGPRAAAFLLRQFERLAERNIQVYWCSGKLDQPDRWPAAASLPDNVITFTSTGFEESVVRRDGQAIATIYGAGYYSSRNSLTDLRVDPASPFPIALAYCPTEISIPENSGVRYWAFGGWHQPRMAERADGWVVWPGTLQARGGYEPGSHGADLVRIDGTGKTRVEKLPIDVVRWIPQSVSFAESASDEDIKNLLADRCLQIAAETPEQIALVDWEITTTGDFNPRLRSTRWLERMIAWLRTEFGSSTKGIWTTGLTIDPARTLPQAWYDEDTMLGDYLKAIGRLQGDPQLSIPLHSFVPESNSDDSLEDLPRVDVSAREAVLRNAMLFGIERLGAIVEQD